MKTIVCTALLLICSISLQAQTLTELQGKVDSYDKVKGAQGLYLHLDKTNYTSNENIWFTGYQLNPIGVGENTLFVSLQNLSTDSIVKTARFIMENGQGKGFLFLGSTIPEGRYRLMAYTNTQLNYPEKPPFQQVITIKKATAMYTIVRSSMTDLPDKTGNYQVTFHIINENNDLTLLKGKIKYVLKEGKGIVIKEARQTVVSPGEFTVSVPKEFVAKPLLLQGTLTVDNMIHDFNVPFQLKDALIIDLYPEGGNLVSGQKSRVAFEIKSAFGKNRGISGSVMENGKKIATFISDDSGLGSFELTPNENATYSLHLNGNIGYQYKFPEVHTKGVSLYINSGMVKDSIYGTISSTKETDTLYLLLHNFRKIFGMYKIPVRNYHHNLALAIPADVPAGVSSITLLDTKEQPVAERAVLINGTSGLNVSVSTDAIRYHARSKVTLKIRIKDEQGNPVRSIFSLASVLSARYDSLLVTSLPSYYYAGQFAHPNINTTFRLNTANPDRVLLTRFWTRYRWEEVRHVVNPESNNNLLAQGVDIQLLYKNIPYRDSQAIYFSGDSINRGTIYTDCSGKILIPYEMLYGEAGMDAGILPFPKSKDFDIKKFSFAIREPNADSLDKNVSKGNLMPENLSPRDGNPLRTAKKGVMLKEVKIIARRDGYNGSDIFNSVTCDDYVCMMNIINCRNHPYDRKTRPRSGEWYLYRPKDIDSKTGEPIPVKYYSCSGDANDAEFIARIKGVWATREFYVADYDKFNPEEPEISSTVFWAHQIMTDQNGEASLSFFTNDLLGDCTIHFQGFSAKGPISGKAFYSVVR